jgi:hypothetical protein
MNICVGNLSHEVTVAAEVDMALAEEAEGLEDENQTATLASNHRPSTTVGSTRLGCHSSMR